MIYKAAEVGVCCGVTRFAASVPVAPAALCVQLPLGWHRDITILEHS